MILPSRQLGLILVKFQCNLVALQIDGGKLSLLMEEFKLDSFLPVKGSPFLFLFYFFFGP